MLKYELKTAHGIKTVVRDIDLSPPYEVIRVRASAEYPEACLGIQDDWTFSNQYGERKMAQHLKHVRHDQTALPGTVIRRSASHVTGRVEYSDCGFTTRVVCPSDAMYLALMGTFQSFRWTLSDVVPVFMVK